MKVYLVNCLTLKRSNQKVSKSYSIQLAPHESLGKRVRSEGPLLDRTPVSKNMPLFTATLTSQDWQKYARAPHPPTRRDSCPPGRRVRCASPAHPTHPPGGQHHAAGCCPPPRWAETNYPSVINQLPARASPFLFMTEATSMLQISTMFSTDSHPLNRIKLFVHHHEVESLKFPEEKI